MSISFNGYNKTVLTVETLAKLNQNTPVSIDSNGNAVEAADGSDFIGIVVNTRDNIAGVQTDGYVEINYTGTAPLYGYVPLVANGNGGVKVYTDGTVKHRVIKVNKARKLVGFLI